MNITLRPENQAFFYFWTPVIESLGLFFYIQNIRIHVPNKTQNFLLTGVQKQESNNMSKLFSPEFLMFKSGKSVLNVLEMSALGWEEVVEGDWLN